MTDRKSNLAKIGKYMVEGPRPRGRLNMSSWARIVDEDGSTVAYVPSLAYAVVIAKLLGKEGES